MQPDYVVFNGYANQYKSAPLVAKAGQRIRLFVVNAGPSNFSAFHVIGALFDKVYVDGNPANAMSGNQTITIPPGGGAVFELVIPQAGSYPFVTHSFVDASKGRAGGDQGDELAMAGWRRPDACNGSRSAPIGLLDWWARACRGWRW